MFSCFQGAMTPPPLVGESQFWFSDSPWWNLSYQDFGLLSFLLLRVVLFIIESFYFISSLFAIFMSDERVAFFAFEQLSCLCVRVLIITQPNQTSSHESFKQLTVSLFDGDIFEQNSVLIRGSRCLGSDLLLFCFRIRSRQGHS